MTATASGKRFRAMTFNVRRDTAGDGEDAWPFRSDAVASIVRSHEPAVVGCQEVLAGQLADLRSSLSGFEWIGRGSQTTRNAGEHVPIGYRRDRLELDDHGTFWLSEQPDVPGSVGWDAELPRIVTWALLHDTVADAEVCVMNTHLDHRGEHARRRSASLLADRFDAIADGRPGIVLGDMNCEPGSDPYETLASRLTDARERSVHDHHGPSYTFHRFDGRPGRWIDYVFVRGFDVHAHAALADRWDDRFPSDHFPVLAVLSLDGGHRSSGTD